MKDQDRYLKPRNGRWHYIRRVPETAKHLDRRGTVQVSLKTDNIDVARVRRDEMEAADNDYWQALATGDAGAPEIAERRYKAAVSRAKALGFVYRTLDDLTQREPIENLVARAVALDQSRDRSGDLVARDVEALLGGVSRAYPPIRNVFDIYKQEIAAVDHKGKSPGQLKKWEETKSRSVENFIKVVGNKSVDEITRDDALSFFGNLQKRVLGQAPEPISVATANRNLGDVRGIIRDYFTHIGEPDRKNPLDGLNFKKERKEAARTRAPFEVPFMQNRVLPALLSGDLNDQASAIMLAMVETGCRPSEIFNLSEDRIVLDAPVPFIRVLFEDDMEIKTASSIRDIPLIGVSLDAMRSFPKGFSRYRDKSSGFSNAANRFLQRADLKPTRDHSVYSIRHSFEKRMLEAGIDADLRRLLMGHSLDRPKYGDGGSLKVRADAISKIAFDPAMIKHHIAA